MKLIHTDYLELPAPYDDVVSALSDPAIWPQALGAERLGTLWRFGAELYRLHTPHWPGALNWSAEPITGLGPRLELELRPTDAVISTHVAVRVSLELPGPGLPWRRALAHRRLRAATRQSGARLAATLRARAAAHAPVTAAAVAVGAGQSSLDDEPALLGATPPQLALVDELQQRYPLTVEQFVTMGALEHLERVARLESGWERILHGEFDPTIHEVGPVSRAAPATAAYDLIYAGGGLSLLHAAVMAVRHRRRVLVFDRGDVGCVHREWNISRMELGALVATGVVTWDELDAVVMREYRDGLVRFHSRTGGKVAGRELRMPEVLNLALDAGALLRLMRRKIEGAGGTICSGRAFRKVRAAAQGPMAVEVELEDLATGTAERYTARLLLDAMGSISPLALLRHAGRPFAGVCPTVGTVAAGFDEGDAPDEVDLGQGDILVTVADAQRGRQLIWEGFPGRDDELTVYMFYYSTLPAAGAGSPAGDPHPAAPRYSLLELFEQYFQLLPSYKRAGPHFRHCRPVYGYIPGRHSLRSQEAPLLRGVLPVGDSAAQQSPLTFCGFGSHVRNLRRTTSLLDYALEHELLEPRHLAAVNAFQANVSVNWTFSRFMHPWGSADDVNQLQNRFLGVLETLGPTLATRFFQDRMRWSDYNRILLVLTLRWPQAPFVGWGVLKPQGLVRFARSYTRFGAEALGAAVARAGGPRAERRLRRLADRLTPALGLRVRARYEEWRAMGWV